MRLARPLLLALALLLIAGAASAEARRKATHAERAAIAAKFDAPPKCARVFISTVDRHWATYRFDGRTFDDPDCRAAAADGVAILRRRHRVKVPEQFEGAVDEMDDQNEPATFSRIT